MFFGKYIPRPRGKTFLFAVCTWRLAGRRNRRRRGQGGGCWGSRRSPAAGRRWPDRWGRGSAPPPPSLPPRRGWPPAGRQTRQRCTICIGTVIFTSWWDSQVKRFTNKIQKKHLFETAIKILGKAMWIKKKLWLLHGLPYTFSLILIQRIKPCIVNSGLLEKQA